ncbi:hypothetical protein [Methylocaldum sp.]|uniref:hypothetical protein n=1 Tax=Methylocaldum sp. TaxID=1969727 RepID=UPI002D7157C7|nr:hypothetical protein [Methylocaldum sp.]HYE36654.1 hypothetical protein [Methylocaldum sp.]
MNATLTPSPETQAMLDSLQQAVAQTLERKKRLGQYVVFWDHNTPIAVGDDAPKSFQTKAQENK